MIKVACLGVGAALVALILRKEREEYAILIALGVGIFVFAYALAQVSVIIDFMENMIGRLPISSEHIGVLFQMLGISYTAEFASNICKDAGYQSIAGQIEVFARLAIVALSLSSVAYLVDVLEALF